jgi:hypothetical protein
MRHSFQDESKLDVREYITKKIQLYYKAGENKEDLVVCRLHEGLDPTLAAAVPLASQYNTIADFSRRVYSAEPTARAQYYQFEEMSSRLAKAASTLRQDRFPDSRERQDHRPGNAPVYCIPAEAARRLAVYHPTPAPVIQAQVAVLSPSNDSASILFKRESREPP